MGPHRPISGLPADSTSHVCTCVCVCVCAQIKSANEILALARQHERKKFIASSSVMLTVEMVKISNAINAYQGEPTRETRTLEDIFEQCRILEDQCRTAARRRMMVYGLLYKRGHIVKNWQMRMFVLDGGKLSYYQLGETESKGHLMLHLVRKVSMVQLPMKRNCFKVETTSKEYIMQAPDEASLQIWMDALRPYKEGWLTKQGAVVKNWKRRWFVLYKTQLAYFDGTSGVFSTRAGGRAGGRACVCALLRAWRASLATAKVEHVGAPLTMCACHVCSARWLCAGVVSQGGRGVTARASSS
jgi:hypothetical protein